MRCTVIWPEIDGMMALAGKASRGEIRQPRHLIQNIVAGSIHSFTRSTSLPRILQRRGPVATGKCPIVVSKGKRKVIQININIQSPKNAHSLALAVQAAAVTAATALVKCCLLSGLPSVLSASPRPRRRAPFTFAFARPTLIK